MSFEPREYLRHIHAEADYLATASVGLTREKYRDDPTLQRAFARSLGIIGEAAKKVPPEVRMQHLDVEWRAMAGMRDRLRHDYFGIDHDLVWDVLQNKIPTLRAQMERILAGA